jgi:hypothetical protein
MKADACRAQRRRESGSRSQESGAPTVLHSPRDSHDVTQTVAMSASGCADAVSRVQLQCARGAICPVAQGRMPESRSFGPPLYFPVPRSTSQREGDAGTRCVRVQYLGWVRVVVRLVPLRHGFESRAVGTLRSTPLISTSTRRFACRALSFLFRLVIVASSASVVTPAGHNMPRPSA